jgi:exonuclease VII large subunit
VRQRGSLRRTMATRLERASQQTTTLRRALYAVGPLETLGRGYAIVATADGSRWGTPITRVDQVAPGAAVEAHLADGTLRATVDAIIPGADDA